MTPPRTDALIIAIDGSSTIRDRPQYVQAYRRSFVRQLFDIARVRNDRKTYLQGPGALAGGPFNPSIASLAAKATNFIRMHAGKSGQAPKIFLTGWSRGACACIQLAHDLRNDFSIECLALFDAVDNDMSTGAFGGGTNLAIIPGNVVNCYHAIADIKPREGIDAKMFPTSGTSAAPGVGKFLAQRFAVSHGGVGGLPALTWDEQALLGAGKAIGDAIKFADLGATARAIEADRKNRLLQDQAASANVKHWMWSLLRPHGLLAG